MKICKLQMAVFFYCALFFCSQAQAQWPVFDFTEISPIVGQVTTTAKTVGNLKNQLNEMIETLDGIGKNTQTIAEFSKDINEDDGQEKDSKFSEEIAENFAKTSDEKASIQDDFTEELSDAEEKQSILIDQMVKRVETTLIDPKPQLKPKEAKEEAKNIIDSFKEESRQVAVEMNDATDKLLLDLNKNLLKSREQLSLLNETLQNSEIDETQKGNLTKRLTEIMGKEQQLSDRGINIVESAKDKYNQKYKNVVEDGINNYQKAVDAYLDGQIIKDELLSNGKNLQQGVKDLSVVPDKEILNNYKEEVKNIKEEIKEIATEIGAILGTNLSK